MVKSPIIRTRKKERPPVAAQPPVMEHPHLQQARDEARSDDVHEPAPVFAIASPSGCSGQPMFWIRIQ